MNFKKTLTVVAILIISTILGLFRESSIAKIFGLSEVTDSFLLSFGINMVIINTISSPLTSSFINIYKGYLTKNNLKKGEDFANGLLNSVGIFLLILVLFLYLIIPHLINLIAIGYDNEQINLTINLAKLLLPSIIFSGLVSILVGYNNSHYSFKSTSLNGVIENIVIIVILYISFRFLGIYGLATGVILGSLVKLLFQMYIAKKNGWKYSINFKIPKYDLKEFLILSSPVVFTTISSQINLIIDRIFATKLTEGAVSALYFANKLVLMPQTIFSTAVGMIVYPYLVKSSTERNWGNILINLSKAWKILLLTLVPSSVILFIFRAELVSIFFGYGKFSEISRDKVATIIPYYLGNLLFGSFVSVIIYTFYSLKKVKITFCFGILTIIFNILLSSIFVNFLGEIGLALSLSLSSLFNLLFLLLTLKVEIKKNTLLKFSTYINYVQISKIIIFSFAIGLLIHFFKNYIFFNFSDTFLIFNSIVCTFLLLVLGMKLFKINIISFLKKFLE